MDLALWGPVFAAVAGLVTFGLKLWRDKIDSERKRDNAISQRDRDELERGMAAVDGLHGDESVHQGSAPKL